MAPDGPQDETASDLADLRWRTALERSSFAAVAAEVQKLPAAAQGSARRELLAAARELLGAAPGPAIELVLLGSAILRVDGEIRSWPLRRALLTVAYLALAPDRAAHRDELVEAVWPDASPQAVRRNFHPTLSVVRRALASPHEALLYERGVYRLSATVDWQLDCDLLLAARDQGEQLAVSGELRAALGAFRQGWRLYRGPLLVGHERDWLRGHRERLRDVYLQVLRRLGETALELGEEQEALDAFRAHLIEDPLAEPIHVALMRIYASQERRDLVRRQFLRLQEGLGDLGVLPHSDTLELYHRLIAGS